MSDQDEDTVMPVLDLRSDAATAGADLQRDADWAVYVQRTEALRQQLAEAQAALRVALRAVAETQERAERLADVIEEGMNRSQIPAYEGSYCVFCHWNNSDGHAASCEGRIALAAYQEATG